MKVSFLLYLFVLIFAPLAFGTVEIWSYATMEIAVGLGALLFFSSIWYFKKSLVVVPGIVPLLLLLAFMMLQAIPLPVELVKILSPSSYDAYSPVLTLSQSQWIPLTINQKATLEEFLRIGCYSLFYIFTVQLLSQKGYVKRTVHIVIGLAAFIALLAIVQAVGSPDKIYWLRNVPQNAHPFGPWINPNQFAGFMEMLSPIALGLFLFYKPRVAIDEPLRVRIVNFFTMPSSNFHLFLGFAASLMALSVFVSLCRGGILTITLSAFVFLLIYNMKRPATGRGAVLVIVGCVIIAISWFGWDTIIAEFNRGLTDTGELTDGRFDIWKDSKRIFQAFFLFGSGFGTYIDIFPSFRSFPGIHIIDHAHNDYIELLTDGGIIGFGLAAWFVLAVLLHGWKKISVRGDQYAVLLGIGAFTGIIAMLIHSVTDFNMHNGADGLYFFFVCGLLVTVVNIRIDYRDTTSLLKSSPANKQGLYIGAALLLTICTAAFQYGALRAQSLYRAVDDIYVSKYLRPEIVQNIQRDLTRAIAIDPFEDLYDYKRAAIEKVFGNRNESLTHFISAARKNPMNGATLQQIGLLIDDTAQAEILLEKGYQRGLDDDELAINFTAYLLENDLRHKAITVIADTLTKSPSLLQQWAPLFEEFSLTRDEIASALSQSVDGWLQYGSYLQSRNRMDEANYYYSTALSLIPEQTEMKPHWFQKVIGFYQKNGDPDKAVFILRQAAELLPDHVSFHLQLGDFYLKEEILFRAKEEFERALMLEPGNRTALKKLRQMGLKDSY